jgi:Shedu protein SduA, C-terminal
MKRRIPASAKKAVLIRSGSRCAFPGCLQSLGTENGFLGVLCHIEAVSPGGPRYNPSSDMLQSADNLILLCPNHHFLVDQEPHIYTAGWLREARAAHYKRIAMILEAAELPKIHIEQETCLSFKEAIRWWYTHKENGNEEVWQSFFTNNPKILAQALPHCVFQLGAKCFLGGKAIDNRGGNLVDFIYANRLTENVTLVEIKTPATPLLGRQYRANAFSVSDELSGAVVQVLNYRDELLKNYFALQGQERDGHFNAFNPKGMVVAGSLNSQGMTELKRKSFELFRNKSTLVQIITYDELFGRVQDIIDMLD